MIFLRFGSVALLEVLEALRGEKFFDAKSHMSNCPSSPMQTYQYDIEEYNKVEERITN